MKLFTGELGRYVRGKVGPVPVKFLLAVVPKISRLRLLAFGRYAGGVMYHMLRKQRRRAFDNLDMAFGDSKSRNEKKRIAKSAFQDFAKTGLETVLFHSSPRNVLRDLVKIEGREHLDKALQRGEGVIGLTAHFGHFLALHGRLGIEGYRVNSVVKALRDEGIEEIVLQMRTGVGVKTIYVSPTAQCVKACRNALRSNEILVLLSDQPQKNGVQVDFFGAPIRAAAGPAYLALASQAAVIPMFAIRNIDDTHRIVIGEPVPVVRTGDRKQDVVVNTQAFNKIIESYVLRYPEQWAWNQRRWRSWK